MPYELDMATAIDGVLQDPDLQRELANPTVQIGETLLKRELLARSRELESEINGEVQSYLEAEQAVEDLLAIYEPWHPWFYRSCLHSILLITLVIVTLIIMSWLGIIPTNWLENIYYWNIPDWQEVIVTIFGWIFFLQAGLFLYVWRRNRIFKNRKDNDINLEARELSLTQALSEIELRLTEVILRSATEIINSVGSPFFQRNLILSEGEANPSNLRISSPTGLTEVSNPTHQADTVARRDLMRLLEAQPGASIGISGPRGSGKSTLLRSLTSGNLLLKGKRAITVYSAAPVDYDPRDFLLHLFASLCRQVLLTHGMSEDRRRLISLARERREAATLQPRALRAVGIAIFFSGSVAVSISAAVALIASRSQTPFVRALELKPGNLFLFGLVAIFVGMLLTFFRLPTAGVGRPLELRLPNSERLSSLTSDEEADLLIQRSLDELEEIHFQRSFTSGWSGAIKVPVGLDWSSSGGVSLAQRQESLPELVDRFRRYVEDVTREHGAVVIAIDELDKIKEATEAEGFVNEIKSIFGISDCFYLVSVSEDAMSSFERRGLALRDAFDSAFDDIKYLDYVNLAGARKILQRRVLNLPDPYLCLCYVLSGGLPRDLIRIARTMFQSVTGENPISTDFSSIAAALVQIEAEAKMRASNTAARGIAVEPETSAFLTTLVGLQGTPTIGSLSAAASQLAISARAKLEGDRPDPDAPLLSRLGAIQRELSAYLEFLDLALELAKVFDTLPGWMAATTKGTVDQLARARQGLESNVGAGMARLALVRAALTNPRGARTRGPARKPARSHFS